MEGAWYTGVADELARCLTDAQDCVRACDALLERTSETGDDQLHKRIVDTVVAPAAVAHALVDLVDQPQQLVLVAATFCRDTSAVAVAALRSFPNELVGEARATFRACVESCDALLAAA